MTALRNVKNYADLDNINELFVRLAALAANLKFIFLAVAIAALLLALLLLALTKIYSFLAR